MNMDTTTTTVTSTRRKTAAEKYVNNTSRLRKWVCGCTSHIIDEETGREAPGPYILRVAGTGLLAECAYCQQYFVLEDTAPRRRLYRGCQHCTNPEAHDHGPIEGEGEGDTEGN
jgi:hypothetical protein